MEISSIGNLSTMYSLFNATSINSASITNRSTDSSVTSTTKTEDQVDLSGNYYDFQSFLDKVRDGTVTEDDLSTMQEKLNESGLAMEMLPSPPPMMMTGMSETNTEEISAFGTGTVSLTSESEDTSALTFESFLEKVKNGTVTEEDLTEMQSILTEVEEEGTAAAGKMPPPPPMTGVSEETDALRSFLDKVQNGTVTDEDLSSIQDILLQAEDASSVSASTVSTVSSASDTDELTFESFLDKVKNGTVTEADLTEMQSLLTEMEEEGTAAVGNMPPPPPPMTGTSEEEDALASFLEKVQSGTVTDEDLASIQEILSQAEDASIVSASTVSTVSGTSDTDELTFESFLDKVKNGTVTEEDLAEMQSLLTEMEEERTAAAGNMPPPPPPMTDEADATSEETDALRSFLEKVQNGTVTDEDLSSIQEILSQATEDLTDSIGTVSDTSKSTDTDELTLKSFLDLLRDGTVSDTDLEDMQALLAEWQETAAAEEADDEEESSSYDSSRISSERQKSLIEMYANHENIGSSQLYMA